MLADRRSLVLMFFPVLALSFVSPSLATAPPDGHVSTTPSHVFSYARRTLSKGFSPPLHWVTLSTSLLRDSDSRLRSLHRLVSSLVLVLDSRSQFSHIRRHSPFDAIRHTRLSTPLPLPLSPSLLSIPLPSGSPRVRSVGLFAPSDHARTECRSINGERGARRGL